MITFRSQAYSSIPLPPEVTFAEAFSRLESPSNAYYLLSLDAESYMQCGGSQSACAIEVRIADANGDYRCYAVGLDSNVTTPVRIFISEGGVWVQQNEVLTIDDAAKLFDCFLARQALPAGYVLRDRALNKVSAPPEGSA